MATSDLKKTLTWRGGRSSRRSNLVVAQPGVSPAASSVNLGRALAAIRLQATRRHNRSLRRLFPRRCMLFSTATLLAGFAVSLLMVMGVLPLTLLLWFVSWFLIVIGGVLVLIFWGEF